MFTERNSRQDIIKKHTYNQYEYLYNCNVSEQRWFSSEGVDADTGDLD